jgi:bifunctional non-homologous end joining protein LigD
MLVRKCEGKNEVKEYMRSRSDSLKTYRGKRNFTTSPEPVGHPYKGAKKLIFVVQKHAATHLHYDFRIEVHGVLKSWAIPKGPSPDIGVKRLAVMTEDHPLEYAGFAGVIPPGNYGAGTVEIWDSGTYCPLGVSDGQEESIDRALENGVLELWFEGRKMKGGYALVRLRRSSDKYWLLVKMNDTKILDKTPQPCGG